MKIKMIKATSLKTGEVVELTEKKWKAETKRKPRLPEFYSVVRFEKEITSFKFVAWVHPKQGGDDYQVDIDQAAANLEEAKAHLESWLKKVSCVTDDYQVAS